MSWGQEDIWFIALIGACPFISCILYMMGGTQGYGKWLRRFVASFILTLAANLVAVKFGRWTWQYLLIMPCLAVGFSLGYGGDTTLIKVLKRALFAVGVLSACFIGLWATHFTVAGWVVMGLATLIGLTSIILGVFNPFQNAPVEQYIICQLLTLFVVWWGLIK